MRNGAIIFARDAAVVLAFLAGGVVGAAVGGLVGFFGLYGVCRAISWATGNLEYMFFMWLGMLVVPVFALMGLVGGGAFAAMRARERMTRRQPRGFEVRSELGVEDAR